jgi:hypothetical protein
LLLCHALRQLRILGDSLFDALALGTLELAIKIGSQHVIRNHHQPSPGPGDRRSAWHARGSAGQSPSKTPIICALSM